VIDVDKRSSLLCHGTDNCHKKFYFAGTRKKFLVPPIFYFKRILKRIDGFLYRVYETSILEFLLGMPDPYC
jgi:hypothetical protein